MSSETINKLTKFLEEIEIPFSFESLNNNELVPGISIKKGSLAIDQKKLHWSGDILYVAGLLATAAPSERKTITNKAKKDPAHEMATIAWAYAAAQHLHIDPKIVFHEGGYQSGGDQLIQQLQSPQAPGAPLLSWYQMSEQFPTITNWVRTLEDPSAAYAVHEQT